MKLQTANRLTTARQHVITQFMQRCFGQLKKRTSFLVLVVIPWALLAGYLIFIKTPVYESTASILIHHYTTYSPISGLKSVFNKNKQQGQEPKFAPLFLIERYIRSEQMLSDLQKTTDIKNHYQSTQIDWLSRLKKNPNQKAFLDYYLKKITVSLDATTGELIISARAFSPDKAHELLAIILDKATQFLQKINHQSALEQSQLIQHNLELSRQKLIQAEATLHESMQNNAHHKAPMNKILEQQKLNLKFAKIEYESYQQAYVLWSLSLKKNTPVKTSTPNLPDYYSYPKIPHDLINLLAILTAIFLLGKVVLLLVREHID